MNFKVANRLKDPKFNLNLRACDSLQQGKSLYRLYKKIILVDESLVRGTTSSKIVKMLYDAGAKEVHLRIASPEIKFPDC